MATSEGTSHSCGTAEDRSLSGGYCGTLVDDAPWDSYDLASLLPLKEVVQEDRELGYLLRHYWIPATELRFRQSIQTIAPDGSVEQEELQIDRRMARCRSNECTWRERTCSVAGSNGSGGAQEAAGAMSEKLCSYDCYEQTYVFAKPVLLELPAGDGKEETRRQALYRMPMLVPPGPVSIGFSWYGKVGDDYMNYRLESEERVGETSVLVIRREGRYTSWLPDEGANSGVGVERASMITERKGVTIFAWNRGAVLEDRFIDQIVDGDRVRARVGTTCRAVTRLVRSLPLSQSSTV